MTLLLKDHGSCSLLFLLYSHDLDQCTHLFDVSLTPDPARKMTHHLVAPAPSLQYLTSTYLLLFNTPSRFVISASFLPHFNYKKITTGPETSVIRPFVNFGMVDLLTRADQSDWPIWVSKPLWLVRLVCSSTVPNYYVWLMNWSFWPRFGMHSQTAIRFCEIHTPLTEAVLPNSGNYKKIVSLC
jgi:hypothetical protein